MWISIPCFTSNNVICPLLANLGAFRISVYLLLIKRDWSSADVKPQTFVKHDCFTVANTVTGITDGAFDSLPRCFVPSLIAPYFLMLITRIQDLLLLDKGLKLRIKPAFEEFQTMIMNLPVLLYMPHSRNFRHGK